jgi:hypothetical protein
MATVSLAAASTRVQHPSRASNVKVPYLVEYVVDLATAATAKGTALAASDVIEAIRIPAETVVLFAGFEIVTAATGGSSDQAILLGDGGDPNRWVDTFDLDAATAGAHGTIVIATANPTVFATADTIDITISAATTVATAGTIRVYAQMVDVSNAKKPGLAALAS